MNLDEWALAAGVRKSVARFKVGWDQMPAQKWKTWLITLTIGWILSGILAYLLAITARRLEELGYFAFDERILIELADVVPLSFTSSLYVGVVGDTLYLIVFIVSLALLAIWRLQPLIGLSILATFFMTDIVVFVSWQTWNRARPALLYDGLASPGLHSFPSGHTVQAIVVYGFLAYLWIRQTHVITEKVFAVAFSTLIIIMIALSRLELGVHWPTDVIGALPVGLAWLASLIIALRRAEAVAGGSQAETTRSG